MPKKIRNMLVVPPRSGRRGSCNSTNGRRVLLDRRGKIPGRQYIALAAILSTFLRKGDYWASAKFVYPDFNQTLGLVLNGDGATACEFSAADEEADADGGDPQVLRRGERDHIYVRTIETDAGVGSDGDDTNSTEAGFGHRDEFVPAGGRGAECRGVRLRLTPSSPSAAGSVWYEKRLPVSKGFDTAFRFQILDQSRTCQTHVDPATSLHHHRSCAVHGGDGLAFVLHGDPAAAAALGADGGGLGYAGIRNSLAVEFDAWTNAGGRHGDPFRDHVSVHSGGRGPNDAGAATALGRAGVHGLADGRVHRARVRYFPRLEERYASRMTAADGLLPYIGDNGEGRRLGTLAVFVDGGIAADEPILAFPLNLSLLLDLPHGLAYAGFTASTGLKWEKHDVLSWAWCEGDDHNVCGDS